MLVLLIIMILIQNQYSWRFCNSETTTEQVLNFPIIDDNRYWFFIVFIEREGGMSILFPNMVNIKHYVMVAKVILMEYTAL